MKQHEAKAAFNVFVHTECFFFFVTKFLKKKKKRIA